MSASDDPQEEIALKDVPSLDREAMAKPPTAGTAPVARRALTPPTATDRLLEYFKRRAHEEHLNDWASEPGRGLDRLLLAPNQFAYVIDFLSGHLYAHRNLSLIGFRESDELTVLDTIKLIYGPDREGYCACALAATELAVDLSHRAPALLYRNALSIDARLQGPDGRVRRVIRSSFILDYRPNTGQLITCTINTDITGHKFEGPVQYAVSGPDAAMLQEDFDERVRALSVTRLTPFTSREQEILRGISQGHSSKMLARLMGISVHTVNKHRANMITRLGLGNTAELLARAYGNGWI